MSQVSSVPFTFRSVTGGVLQLASGSLGSSVTLGSGTGEAAQWSLQPSGDGFSVYISNKQYGTFISGDPSANNRLRAGAMQNSWLLYSLGSNYFAICYNPACSMVWAPLGYVAGGTPGSTEVVVAGASGAQFEWWELIQVGSQSSGPPPSAPPVASATSPGGATSIQAYPQPTNTGLSSPAGDVRALSQCKPCGNTDCSFTPSGSSSPATYSVLIGRPVANCNTGSNETTTTKFGGKYELSTSFSVETTAGVTGLGTIGPSFSTTVGKSEGTKTETAQEVEVPIGPGKVGALVANITYTRTPGTVAVGKSSLGFVAVEPGLVLGYSVVYIDCGSDFSALTLPKEECSQTSAASRTANGLKVAVLWSILLLSCIFM